MDELGDLIRRHLGDRASSWAISCYGAAAEFHWVPGDVDRIDDVATLTVATARGALRVRPSGGERPLAYETLSALHHRWMHGIAICAPAARGEGARRRVLTELDEDADAVLGEHRRARLFDLGLGATNFDACIRTADEALARVLRRHAGASLLEGDGAAMRAIREASPHRVFVSPLARIEVYQAIPPAGDAAATPEGPHTHLLPELLASGRTHAATVPIPRGWLPLLQLYPPSPVVDEHGRDRPYDAAAHARFESLLERWGDPVHVGEKRRAREALRAGVDAHEYAAPSTRAGRLALRIAVRQHAVAAPDAIAVDEWRTRFDPAGRRRTARAAH